MISDIKVLILAGGQSTRFWPLSNKQLFKYLGKTIIDYQIDLLKKSGFKNIIIVGSKELFNNIDHRALTTIIQSGQGMAGAVLSAKEKIKNSKVLVVILDIVNPNLFDEVYQKIKSNSNFLIGYKTNTYFAGGYLVIKNNQVTAIIEKPGKGNEPSNYVNLLGGFFMDSNKLLSQLEKLINSNPLKSYEQAVTQMIEHGQYFELLKYQDEWVPIKYPWDVLRLSKYFLGKINKFQISSSAVIHPTAIISGKVIIGDNVKVLAFAKIQGPAYIGNNTIIGDHALVRESIIGEGCVIGFSSEVARSYLRDNIWLHSNYIGDSVIDSDVAIGAHTVCANLRLDEKIITSKVKGEILETGFNKLGAIIGSESRIGVSAKLMPGVKIGKRAFVGPGTILSQDVADKQIIYIKQELIISKTRNYKLSSREQFRNKI